MERTAKQHTHSHTQHVHTRHAAFLPMCAHTVWLTRSHAMGWSHRHAFTCNTHAHNMLPHETRSPIHVHVFKMRAHTHPLHTHAHTHTCTHMAAWTHTDPQSCTCVLPKMLTQIHAQTEKHRQDHRETSPDPTTPMTTSQRHTQLKNTHRKSHTQSHTWTSPEKPQCTQEKTHEGPHPPHTPAWGHIQAQANEQSHRLLLLRPQVLPPDGRSERSPWAGVSRPREQRRRSSPARQPEPTPRACQAAPPANKERMCKNKTERLR